MYPILEDAFLRFPMRKKVVELMLKRGFRVDKKANIYCGEVEISPVKIARALNLDRRVVIETAQLISDVPELLNIFEGLYPTAFIRGAAKNLGFEVIELESEPHAVGVVSEITTIIAQEGISIRQVVSDDPDIYPNPRLTIVIEKKLPGSVLAKLRDSKLITKLIIE
ncbi:regulator [Candidatus Micrarchaeota archaeon]|nr:regulator [Candidatus Micrarchaeota archaeon]